MDHQIKQLTLYDLEVILRLAMKVWGDELRGGKCQLSEYFYGISRRRWEQTLTDEEQLVYGIAASDQCPGELLGLLVATYPEENPGFISTGPAMVDPLHRKIGLYGRLKSHVEEWARTQGYLGITCYAAPSSNSLGPLLRNRYVLNGLHVWEGALEMQGYKPQLFYRLVKTF